MAATSRSQSRTLVIGVDTFNRLKLNEEEKAYLRTQFVGKRLGGKLWEFHNEARVRRLLEFEPPS